MRRLAFRIIFLLVSTSCAGGETSPPTPAPDPVMMKVWKNSLKRVIGSYNSVDVAGLRREFSPQAPGLTDEGAFRRLFFRYYLDDLGRLKSTRLIPADSNFDPKRALLVYEAAFDYWPRVKVSASFIDENGEPRLMQLRFEKIETN